MKNRRMNNRSWDTIFERDEKFTRKYWAKRYKIKRVPRWRAIDKANRSR